MASSLAVQLAQNASLNTGLLSHKRSDESYLFTGKDADAYDYESILALATNGLLQLASLNSEFSAYENTLFSQASRNTDRTLLSKDAAKQLDKSIGKFLAILAPYIMEAPAGKVLEWLVRRYRINEFNLEQILTTFLPYHESPHFAKMLSILHIKPNSTWSFLLPVKSAAVSLSRYALVTEMLKNTDLFRFVVKLLPDAIESGRSHRTLLAFNAACLHEFITRSKNLEAGTMAALLPALLKPLQSKAQEPPKDALLGSYILLSILSQKCDLTEVALKAIIAAMSSCAHRVSAKQFLSAAISICEPQPQCSAFSDAVVTNVLELSDLESEITKSATWAGFEKLLCPMLPSIVSRLPEGDSLLSRLIITSKMPSKIQSDLTTLLLQRLLENSADLSARNLLADVKQRHPKVLREAREALSDDDDDLQAKLDQIIVSLSVTVTPSLSSGDSVLASLDSDETVREAAVKSLFAELPNSSGDQKSSLVSAFLARIQDTSLPVLTTLYTTNPDLLSSSIETDSYIQALSSALAAMEAKPKRAILRLHLTFLFTHIFGRLSKEQKRKAFYTCIYPFLLFSKPRQHTAECVWDIVAEAEDGDVKDWELLSGCAEIWKEVNAGGEEEDGFGRMVDVNERIVQKIADNLVTSNDYQVHLGEVLSRIGDQRSHVSNLSQIVARAVVLRLSGEHQIDAALATLNAYQSIPLVEVDWAKWTLDTDVFDFKGLGRAVVGKPNSPATSQLLRLSFLRTLSTLSPPAGIAIDWVTALPSPSDQRGPQYVQLCRQIYSLVHSSNLHQQATSAVLQSLFSTLADDVLAFLAGIWCSEDLSLSPSAKAVALDYARAVLQAHVPQETGVDFQTILPALLVALQSVESDIRGRAAKCIQVISQITEKKFSSKSPVYGFDVIYGHTDREIQYLDHPDLKRYLVILVEHQDHLLHDPQYLNVVHRDYIAAKTGDKKKDAEFKHHIRCYLFSHINAFVVPSAQVALLRSLKGISDNERALILSSSVETLAEKGTRKAMEALYGPSLEEFSSLLFDSFDEQAAEELNKEPSGLWDLLLDALKVYLSSGETKEPLSTLSRNLEAGLFAVLALNKKVEICDTLLDIGVSDVNTQTPARSILLRVSNEVPVVTRLLQQLQPEDPQSSPAAKKAKVVSSPKNTLPKLVLYAEVLASAALPGSVELVSHLLDTLNNVLQASPSEIDVNYLEQLLMTAVEKVASQVTDLPNITPSTIRLDVLVELIRVVDNPQTFKQALLLTATLARLAPESVLRNIMPVFTFMGSNVFHRDDSYSFRVVQKTIESIVPVMASSLRESSPERLALYIGARDLLRVFADAYNHIPRHRRTSLFIHLVDTLGSTDFLAPMCMLLVEKVVTKIIRQSPDDARHTLALPLAVLHHYPKPLQLFALTETLREAQRLAVRLTDPQNIEPHLLDWSTDEDRSPAVNTLLRRRSQALILFAGLAMKGSGSTRAVPDIPEGGSINDYVSLLISLSTLQGNADVKLEEVAATAQTALGRSLEFMAARDFIQSTVSILDMEQERLQLGAIQLFKERVSLIADKTRRESSVQIVAIIKHIQTFIKRRPEDASVSVAFQALAAVGNTMESGEENALADGIPLIVNALKRRKNLAPALDALSPLAANLGPRIIPHFRDIVKECVSIMQEASDDEVHSKSLDVLLNLLRSIPSFWGQKEIAQVIILYINQSHTGKLAYQTLAKRFSKKVPAAALLSTLVEVWTSISHDQKHLSAYLHLLKRALQNTPRPVVNDHVRPTFDVFIKTLDVLKDLADSSEAENALVPAFIELVVKLNDLSFRPLFRKMYDWAFARDTADDRCKLVFCHLFNGLLDYFKALMNPYMTFLFTPFVDFLKSFASEPSSDLALWSSIVEILTNSMNCDEGNAFWRDDKLSALLSPLVAQVPHLARTSTSNKDLLTSVLAALTEATSSGSPDILKQLNIAVLMHTRSSSAAVRQYALEISEVLWSASGGKLLGFVGDTAPFIVEAAEDENDDVVRAALKLKESVESIAGKISDV